jgi:hypothetical protein
MPTGRNDAAALDNPDPSHQAISGRTVLIGDDTAVVVATDTLRRPDDPTAPPRRDRTTVT